MLRTHLAQKPDAIVLHDVTQGTDVRAGAYKPNGFWYEVDGDWRRWSADEDYFNEGTYYIHRVELNDCHVLKIATLDALDAFHWRYGIRKDWTYQGYSGVHVEIPWRRVAEEHDGVEIAPYQWERRLASEFSWYYGWDCASGVVWRPKNASVTFESEFCFPERAALNKEAVS